MDVVANGGAVWYKATARNPEALEEISRGRSEHGQKSITHAARLYRHCADKNLHHFKPPKVHCIQGYIRYLSIAIMARPTNYVTKESYLCSHEKHIYTMW